MIPVQIKNLNFILQDETIELFTASFFYIEFIYFCVKETPRRKAHALFYSSIFEMSKYAEVVLMLAK